ncbi:MAG: DUF2141 domain-containing protein [Sphingomonadales bacterium]|nr:DUF2141 domain-containing protein [Sphingomonadales bacterium]MDE2569831.1 DUF2141 domain-containing protein [Sphingomonadales bacterium]
MKVRLAAGLAALTLLAGAAPPPPAASPGTTVTVAVEGLRSHKGNVLACLTGNPRGFPDCTGDPSARHLSVAATGDVVLVFRDVPPGRYAISLFHDENANGKLDKLMMMPREGFGFSRNAPVRFGPPSFSAAAFDVAGGAVREAVRLRYML